MEILNQRNTHQDPGTRVVPEVPGYPVVGVWPKMLGGMLQFFVQTTRDYGDLVRFRFGPQMAYMVNHPDLIKHVLQDNQRNYPKGNTVESFKLMAGEGLGTSEGDVWLQQRRLIQPAFHRQRIAALGQLMTEVAGTVLQRWQAFAPGQPVDLETELDHLALEIAVKALFSTDVVNDADTVSQAMRQITPYINAQISSLVKVPVEWPLPQNRRFKSAIASIDRVVSRIIRERRQSGQELNDLLGMLLAARDEETGEGMSDAILQDQVRTFLMAGYETTSSSMIWVWILLSQHPDVARRLYQEVTSVLAGRVPTVEDLPNLPYTLMVIQEALRLYPPIWLFTRTTLADDVMGNAPIPANSLILICPYTMHRHGGFWDNPEGFDPERFASGGTPTLPRFAYFPFGGGPRRCIGSDFAMMELHLVVAMIAQRYRLHLVPGNPVEPSPVVFLRPRRGWRMTIHHREEERNREE